VRAVSDLELGNKSIRFLARFGGVSQQVDVPMEAVIRVYAQENEQGIVFSPEEQSGAPEAAAQDGVPEGAPTSSEPPPRTGGPRLRVVK
jgi:stringent starvation protein B